MNGARPPNNEVRIAVIGLGGRGRGLVRMFRQNPLGQVIAASDINNAPLTYAKKIFGNSLKYYMDSDEMLSGEDVDAIAIATPDWAHRDSTLLGLAHEKHIYLEKPMAQRIEDCDEMIRAWQKKNLIFMIGFELRHSSIFQEMKKIIDRGDIGDIKLAYAVDNVSVGGDYFFHNYYRRKDKGFSLVLQKGCHSIDLMNWFIGSRPVRVFALGGLDAFGGDAPNDKRCRNCDKIETCPYAIKTEKFLMDYGEEVLMEDLCVYAQECNVHDNSIVLIQYESGVRASYTECHFTPDYSREFTLIGDKGRMYGFYNNAGDFKIRVTYRHSEKVDEYFPKSTGGSHGGGDRRIIEEFIECVLTGKAPLADPISARDAAAIAIAAEDSIESGQPIDIPPYRP